MVGANAPSLTLITGSGYLMLVKPFNDDRSWQIQRQLVKLYFRVKAVAEQPAPQPTLSADQWNVIRNLIGSIMICCKFKERANHAVHERIRFQIGLHSSSELRPEHFDAVKDDLESLKGLAEHHLHQLSTLDEEFINAVIRPPVSIRKLGKSFISNQSKCEGIHHAITSCSDSTPSRKQFNPSTCH